RAARASCSRLEPGKTTMAAFMGTRKKDEPQRRKDAKMPSMATESSFFAPLRLCGSILLS
ncbi:MAG TPA: hypothetical protein VE914_24850, partial [Candidatus Angelobacter sp.]|nr:hypothetical protein [Candidatus Angelobacter sp.]